MATLEFEIGASEEAFFAGDVVEELFLGGDVTAQGLEELLALLNDLHGRGRGGEDQLPPEFTVGAQQTEVFLLQPGVIVGVREAEQGRVRVLFLLAAVLADCGDFSFQGLQMAEAQAA